MLGFYHQNIHDIWDWVRGELHTLLAAIPSKSNASYQSKASRTSAQDFCEATALARCADILVMQDGTAVFTGSYLKLRGSARKLPFSRLAVIGEVTASQRTPFPLDVVHVIPFQGAEDDEYCFYLIKKEHLDPSLDLLAQEQFYVSRLGIRDGDRVHWISTRALPRLHPAFHHIRHGRNFLIGVVTTLAVALSFTYVHALSRYVEAERVLDDVLAAKKREALQVHALLVDYEKKAASIQAAREGKSKAQMVLRIWEELTRALPDGVWLTDLTFETDVLTITGYAAQSAAGLIVALGSSHMFTQPSFIAPVVRVPGQSGERFEIRLKVRSL
ncbi:PilN domain-containing protein [Agrobacterium sp. 22117]|uniref:PilN domain-containing protein n=1 Tax=Agrobacterium sp. 22117 TaxID=3453880 RepID=UPI003F8564C7